MYKMNRPIFPSSQELTKTNLKQAKFPWHELKPGMSWAIQHNEVSYGTLKSMASRFGMKLGYKFRVVDHGPEKGYEVGCMALTHNDIEFRRNKNKNNDKEIKEGPTMSLIDRLNEERKKNEN